jgi:hypothetical protein
MEMHNVKTISAQKGGGDNAIPKVELHSKQSHGK